MDKFYACIEDAIADIPDGATIAIGGFFAAGVPRTLLRALAARKVSGLTLACGSGPLLGAKEEAKVLVENGQIRKIIDSYGLPRSPTMGRNDAVEQKVRSNEIELEVYPMGTLAEKYRSAGAGIPAFYTPTGAGTVVATSCVTNRAEHLRPKEVRSFGGRECVLECALPCDFAFVHAFRGDREGNLQYRKTARNFNHVMATAAKVTIAEVEELVEVGELEPDRVHTPGIYIQRVVQVARVAYEIKID
jgi:3-oxoacid CoA-transferase subunit A